MTDMVSWPFSQGLTGGPWRWPVEQHVYLLLDGVRIQELPRRLYEWSEGRLEADLLYAGTPWATVSNVSPWLVRLSGPDDPVLQRFLEEGLEPEWGYLIIGQASLLEVADHLRRLVQVVHPSGVPMLLRLADPAVMSALLIAESSPAHVPWGAIDQLVAPNAVTEEWGYGSPAQVQAEPIALDSEGYRLSEVQLARLQACDLRRDTRQLLCFVERHCNDWLPDAAKSQRYACLERVIGEARDMGFNTPREWALLCTLMARLGTLTWHGHTDTPLYHELSDKRLGGIERLEAALSAATTSQSYVRT